MSAKNLKNRMGDHHEAHLVETYGGRRTRGSGSQWRDQTDVRHHRYHEAVAFAFDGKSTRAASMSIKRSDLDKLVEQAHGERPCMAIRFYSDDRLRFFEDWALLREDDLLELIERSRRLDTIEEELATASPTIARLRAAAEA